MDGTRAITLGDKDLQITPTPITVGDKGIDPPGTRTVTIVVPHYDCTVSLIASNDNAASVPAIVALKWAGASSAAVVHKPTLYILAVGIGAYTDPIVPKLAYPAKDARDFVQLR